METIEFQGKIWQIIGKIKHNYVRDPSILKHEWKCDMVMKNRNYYFLVDEIIDAEFEDL